MTFKSQVANLELSKRLKELGVKQESLFWWVRIKDEKHFKIMWSLSGDSFSPESKSRKTRGCGCCSASFDTEDDCSAFTSSELGEMLPLENQGFDLTKINEDDDKGWRWEVARHINHDADFGGFEKTEADARAKMLIYLLENSLIPLPING